MKKVLVIAVLMIMGMAAAIPTFRNAEAASSGQGACSICTCMGFYQRDWGGDSKMCRCGHSYYQHTRNYERLR